MSVTLGMASKARYKHSARNVTRVSRLITVDIKVMAPLRFILVPVALAGCIAAPSFAQDSFPGQAHGLVSELRLGLSAYNVHYNMLPYRVWEFDLDTITDISYDVLFTSPDIDAFKWMGSPRPEIGITANLGGKESLLHAGLTWQVHVADTPVFLEGTFGAAIHSGKLGDAGPEERNMGCRINFYERFGIGTDIGKNATAILAYEHTSNADLCTANAGLSNLGVRIGWKF